MAAGPLRVLVTNDDGVDAPGIAALARACEDAGFETVVAAPARQYSGSGAAILIDDDARAIDVHPTVVPGFGGATWSVGGAPAMCVVLGLRGSFGEPPDVVLSGINYGANTGRVLLHSGTIGAALTAGVAGVRAIAVSLDVPETPRRRFWDTAAQVAVGLVPVLLAEPEGTVLNVNVPNRAEPGALVEAALDGGGVVSLASPDADRDEQVRVGPGPDGAGGTDTALLARGRITVTSIAAPAAVPLTRPLP